MTRVESAVFMLRGTYGATYAPPPAPWGHFTDDWSSPTISWGQAWAHGMWVAGLTAGCQANPPKFCPATQFSRVEAAVFGLRMKYGMTYAPPAASGTLFADDWSSPTVSWGLSWAEKAYQDGLLVACGTSGGKPLFCPSNPVDRAWAAYLIVNAKGLTLAP
jgi:hypothetical protein